MPNTADIAAPAGVRAILEDWARRIDDDGTPSQIVSAEEIRAALAAIEPQAVAETFQQRVQQWMLACFGEEISADRVERGDRLLEEVFELLQSGGYDPARVLPLRDYVWSRDVGEPSQEVGGVEVTLAAYCLAHGLDKHVAGETELARIWTKVEQIRAKQAAKPKHSPLPVSPVTASDERAVEAALHEAIDVLDGLNDDEINLELLPRLRAALAAAPKAHPVQGWQTPEGYALVPIEPTPAMIKAYCDECERLGLDKFANARIVWPIMLAAAPLSAGPSSKEGQ